MFLLHFSAGGGRRLGLAACACWTLGALPLPALAQPSVPAAATETWPRSVDGWLEAQIALARLGFSCGPIDGVAGGQSGAALSAYQSRVGVRVTGNLDPATAARLQLTTPAFTAVEFTLEAMAQLQPVSPTWLGKSAQRALGYETALEWAAELGHASPALIRQLNPAVDWTNVLPGTHVTVPAIGRVAFGAKAAQLRIELGAHTLQAFDEAGRIMAHFPVSIARQVEKRPSGVVSVTVVIADPDYTFDPAIFTESEEGRELGRRLRIPPGPNNPVGVAWIGLNLPGYGIHGTPAPEKIGRTESHGCFRVANWDARTLLDLAWVGLPLVVDP